jgi:SAM-dependent MidA family methyltransferase
MRISAALSSQGIREAAPELTASAASRLLDGAGEFEPAPAEPAPARLTLGLDRVHSEIVVDPRARGRVPEAFHSFKDYMEAMLHDADWGYYTSGRVKFGNGGDFITYPALMSPYFGGMLATRAFGMWEGMLKAGTISKDEEFTVAEFGGGDGTLAHDFLKFAKAQARAGPLTPWGLFFSRLRYVGYELSAPLRKRQKRKNAAFGASFRSVEADARDPLAAIAQGSLKGLILSNELPDAFGVHKVAYSPDGQAEAAFVVAHAGRAFIGELQAAGAPEALLRSLERADDGLRRGFGFGDPGFVYFDRSSFEDLMAFLSTLPGEPHERLVGRLGFHETYLPASRVPDLAEHIRLNARETSPGLAGSKAGRLAYANTDADRFIQGAGAALKAGYVLTIDYGHHARGLIAQSNRFKHFRTYRSGKVGFNPYETPSLRDMTADVDFSALAESGERAGLRVVHYGPQSDLAAGLPWFESMPRRARDKTKKAGIKAFFTGADSFRLLVQQKAGTDEAYRFSDKPPEAIAGLRARP